MKIEIKYRFENKVKIKGNYKSLKECCEKNNADLFNANLFNANLRNADLSNANLSNTNLCNANLFNAFLSNANLYNADLLGIKNYSEAHPVFFELVRKEKVETFTAAQWSIIGQIQCHNLCWDSIKKRFGKKIIPIFKVLAKKGFTEFLKRYEKILK